MGKIREEFEKAFDEWHQSQIVDEIFFPGDRSIALWAAKWMAERCAKEAEFRSELAGMPYKMISATEIRELTKEFEQ